MHPTASEILGARPPEIRLSGRLRQAMSAAPAGHHLRLGLTMSVGPCRDSWCEPLTKLSAEITSEIRPRDVRVDAGGYVIYIEPSIYYSAAKLRDSISIGITRGGRITVSGLSSF